MDHTFKSVLGDSVDRGFLLLGDFERVEMPTGRLNQGLGFNRPVACN